MKGFVRIASLLTLCTAMAQAAETPPGCLYSTLPLKYQKPVEDLAGKLPVADYLDAVLDCSQPLMPGTENPLKPRSRWLEADASRYTEFLAQSKYEWLVLPAQTQYYGFDAVERALIGAEVADALGEQVSAPDTFLVARALGERRRRFELGSVSRLTGAVGAKHLIEVYAGHDGQLHMTLTLQLKDCSATGCKLIKQRDWRALPFSDEQPPFRVVHGLQTQIRREFLGMAVLPALATTRAAPVANPLLNVSISKLIAPAYRSSAAVDGMLASLAPSNDESGQQRLSAWALRSALRAGNAPSDRFLAAYAAQDLNRRPYALKLLEGLEDPAARTLRELLNGNLTEAQAGLAAVRDPLPRMLLAIGVQTLSIIYDRKTAFDPQLPAAVFGNAAANWEPLVMRRLNDIDSWKPTNSDAIKLLLDSAFPVDGLSMRSVVQGSQVVGRGEESGDIDTANIRHVRAALGRLKAGDCCGRGVPRNASWQLYWLLETSTDANVMKELWRLIRQQGSPEQALHLVDRYDDFYEGNPQFEMARGFAAAGVGAHSPGDRAARYNEQFEKSERIAAYWAQGQSSVSNTAVHRGTDMRAFDDAYSRDFPRRPYWPTPMWADAGSAQRLGCVPLAYSTWDVRLAETCLQLTPEAQRPPIRAALRGRFHGAPGAATLAAEPAAAGAEPIDDAERLRASILSDPDVWDNYLALGTLLAQRGSYAEAQKVFMSFPAFKSRGSENAVGLSNGAYIAGSELYWRGQPDLARPLYQIAADLDTGSAASITSAARLALLDGDFETAASESLARARRYDDAYAYRDYLSLLHVLGHGVEARDGFMQVANLSENPQAWASALVGDRMQGKSYEQMKAWVLTDEIRTAHYRGWRFAPGYALLWVMTDRKPPADFPRLMDQIERDAPRTIDSPGMVARPHRLSETGLEIVHASALRVGKSSALPAGTHVKSEYTLLADALTALQGGDYPGAVTKFVALADLYPIERDFTKVALPYFALAAAKTGDKVGLERFIETLAKDDDDFDVWLGRAFFAAVRHDAGKAQFALTRAFGVRPHTDLRPVMTEYQYAEACEIVGRETGDPRFTRMLLDWARQNQRIMPTSAWAYAMEAQYSTVAIDVNRALALTIYLDPASPRLKKFDAARLAAARAWLKQNNPFLQARPAQQSRGVHLFNPRVSPAS